MPSKKLTDRQLAELYIGLARHYQDCVKKDMAFHEIFNELAVGIHCTLNNPEKPLGQLDKSEHKTVYHILNTFILSTPKYRNEPSADERKTIYFDETFKPVVININYPRYGNYYNSSDNFYYQWYWINHSSHCHPDAPAPAPKKDEKETKKENEALAFLLLLLLSAAVAACTFVAIYYLLSQTLDSFERYFFDEGWMQASMNLLSIAVTTTASTLLASSFASSALFSLAIAAGVSNPMGWVTFGVIGLGVIGGALGQLLSEQIQQFIVKQSNQDSLDPQDPNRFTLTAKEACALEDKGIDPIKVKCAIVALRGQLGGKPISPSLPRLFTNSKENDILAQVRALRSGAIKTLTVGDMEFDCKLDNHHQPKVSDEDPAPAAFSVAVAV